MIKLLNMTLEPESNSAVVSLFADTKEEVTNTPPISVVGIPDGFTISASSSCLTASGELAFMKSDGTWNWC